MPAIDQRCIYRMQASISSPQTFTPPNDDLVILMNASLIKVAPHVVLRPKNLLSSPGLLNFGDFEDIPYNAYEMPLFAAMGCIGGIFGAFFNSLNLKITRFRMRHVHKRMFRYVKIGVDRRVGKLCGI